MHALHKIDDITDPEAYLQNFKQTPHAGTGFSLYELLHGRNLRGPLEAIKSGWLHNQITLPDTVHWVAELRETLTALHKQAYENEESYNEKSKQTYDQSSKPRSYELGNMVLYHPQG